MAHLAQISKYHTIHEIPLWVALESIDCDPFSIANLLCMRSSDGKKLNNPITKHSLAIWHRFKMVNGLQSPHVPLLSFLKNLFFYPAWASPNSFRAWTSFNLTRLYDLTSSTSFKMFPDLCKNHGSPIRHYSGISR